MDVSVTFWDVQHGHSTYIRSPNGKHIVVDLGVGSYGRLGPFSPLLHLRNQYGITQLDLVVITHPHKDHIEDMFNFDQFSPVLLLRPNHLRREEVLANVCSEDLPLFEKYFEIDQRYSQDLGVNNPIDPGSDPNYFGGLVMKRFLPTACSTSNLNNHSIISVIFFAGIKIVIPGDNESPSFNELMKDANFRLWIQDSDVLLAPHHGREAGYHEEFVSLVNPRLTVISDGRFGDTSATDKYTAKSRGWDVHKRSGGQVSRYCLTTRNDGVIHVSFGRNNDASRFLSVDLD